MAGAWLIDNGRAEVDKRQKCTWTTNKQIVTMYMFTLEPMFHWVHMGMIMSNQHVQQSIHPVCVEFILSVLVHCSTPRRHMKWAGLKSSCSNKPPNLKSLEGVLPVGSCATVLPEGDALPSSCLPTVRLTARLRGCKGVWITLGVSSAPQGWKPVPTGYCSQQLLVQQNTMHFWEDLSTVRTNREKEARLPLFCTS